MKKLIVFLMAVSLFLTNGCGSKTEQEVKAEPVSTTAIVQQIEAEEPEVIVNNEVTEGFKGAYLEVLNNSYGEYTITDDEYDFYTGTLFAELFDWNLDGEPELMVGYATDEEFIFNIEYLDVYTMENGEAKKILTTEVHGSYGALDGSQSVIFAKGNDGTLYLGVSNEETNEMVALGETYYSFKDGKVESTRFFVDVNFDWDGIVETTYENHKIDGKNVTEKQFNDKRTEFGADDAFYATIGHCEYDMLVDYLEGETETYTNQLFTRYDDPDYNPSWINGVDFGYKTTFTK